MSVFLIVCQMAGLIWTKLGTWTYLDAECFRQVNQGQGQSAVGLRVEVQMQVEYHRHELSII